MNIYNDRQNSPEWFKRKLGVISSSRVKNVISDKVMNKSDVNSILISQYEEELSKDDNTFYDNSLEDKEKEKIKKKMISDYKKTISSLDQIKAEQLIPKEILYSKWHETRKKEYFRVMAEKLGYFDDLEEDPRDRGHRLEDEAAEAMEKELGIESVKVGFITREDYPDIGLSPDRLVLSMGSIAEIEEIKEETSVMELEDFGENHKIYRNLISLKEGWFEAGFEIKSPGVANHLEIIFTRKVPDEYWGQVIQYFVVGEVNKVYFASYNPLVIEKPLFIIEIRREDVLKDINDSLYRQIETVEKLNEDIDSLIGF